MNAIHPAASHESLVGYYAGFASRLVAFVVDSLVISVIVVSITWFVKTTLIILQTRNIVVFLSRWLPKITKIDAFLTSPAMIGVYALIIIVSYNVFFWAIAGQTIGKAVMGIKIIPVKGGKMTLKRAIIRYIGYYVSGLPFGLGFLWILLNDRRAAWHDSMAGTCVVYAWDARPDEIFLVTATEQISRQRFSSNKLLEPGNTGSVNQKISGKLD